MHLINEAVPLCNIMRPQCTVGLQAKLHNLLISEVNGGGWSHQPSVTLLYGSNPTSGTLGRTLVDHSVGLDTATKLDLLSLLRQETQKSKP